MSRILKRIIESIEDDAEVRELGVYSRAAAVLSRRAGVAYGFWNRARDNAAPPDCTSLLAGLKGATARQLSELSLSDDPIEASIGVAAINSLVSPHGGRLVMRNGYQIALEHAASKRLAVVGHFSFVEDIRSRVEELWVLELDPREGDLPAEMAPEVIPRADVVVITGTTLVNHTADDLLELARGRTIIMLGPTTIMSPLLFEFGVSAVCGVDIVDPAGLFAHLKRGGGMRDLSGIRRVCLMP